MSQQIFSNARVQQLSLMQLLPLSQMVKRQDRRFQIFSLRLLVIGRNHHLFPKGALTKAAQRVKKRIGVGLKAAFVLKEVIKSAKGQTKEIFNRLHVTAQTPPKISKNKKMRTCPEDTVTSEKTAERCRSGVK
ncbi:hypothetical protein ElyMa_003666800 [Elysia marginata]|uniref:Uncharacterized protein n=1 Tax=Elysia marginata TaxID=1093978 RepID=A0AAV4EXG5_9GAST|nr:hypothetical protein ElyMa_003666800 [Elysia marginata]